jgi:hypothetical protein
MILIAYDGSDNASRAAADGKAEEGAALARAHGIEAAAHAIAREDSIADRTW